MKSETRANWIFLGIFLLIMGPGLTMLTMKAYKKGAAGMNPPAPKTVASYNNPNPQSPFLPRVVPPQTAAFVESLVYRISNLRPGLQRRKQSDGAPLMSDRLTLELLAAGKVGSDQYVAMVGWDRRFAPLPDLYRFSASQGDASVPLKVVAYEQVNLPLDVRSELQQYGYLLPPDSVIWMVVQSASGPEIDQIHLRYEIEGKLVEDRLDLTEVAPPTTRASDGLSR